MTTADLIEMFGNLSASLPSINHLLGGFSYLLGIVFYISSFHKFKELFAEGGGGHHKQSVPWVYFFAGSALFYLPTMIDTLSNTLFGSGYNILAYSDFNRFDIRYSVTMLIQTAGILWFIRGCVLLAHASQPEQGQEGSKGYGPKGILFLVASLFAININATERMLYHVISQLMRYFSGGAPG